MTRLPCELASPVVARRKAARRICIVADCTRPAAHHRRICNTCRDRRWRAKYPELQLFKNLKSSAKRRGLPFTITFPWWLSFCEVNAFVEIVGRTKGSASIDRVESHRGYEPDNIQVLEIGDNSSKGQGPAPANCGFYTEDENPLL